MNSGKNQNSTLIDIGCYWFPSKAKAALACAACHSPQDIALADQMKGKL
jgi:hypothetical protein